MSHGAITLVRRQYLAILRRCASLNASGWMALGGFSAGLGLLTGGVAQAAGPGIVTDGRTQTAVTPVGGNPAVIDVTTQTVKGVNGFNSFSQFSVYGGQTVNLHVPQGAANLLNLVNGPQSQIDGVLNAYKDGRIGGNVFFFNPQGIVVGAGGQINVGSLMLATPTQAYMDRLMDGQGRIDDAALAEALAGRVPLSASGLISVKGQVRAIDGALLAAGRVEVAAGGQVQAGGAVRVAFGQLVNVDGLKEGGVSFLEGDTVRIVASGDVDVAGRVSADGAGTGAAAQGGRVHVWADGTARLLQGGVVSARGGDTEGDGGHIEFSATQTVSLGGGRFDVGAGAGRAGSVLIDPNDIEVLANSIFTDGGSYTLVANNSITVKEDVVLSTRKVANPNAASTDHETAVSTGDSGDLSLLASHIDIQRGAKLLAQATGPYKAGKLTLKASHVNAIGATRTADASIRIDRATLRGGDIFISAEADTSAIATLLSQSPQTTLAEAQKFVDNELDNLSDGPGGEFLAITTKATARTEVLGSRIIGSGDVTIQSKAAARAGFDKNALAETLIGDAPAAGGQPAVSTVIQGRNVKVDAVSSTSFKLDVLGTAAKLLDQSWLPSDSTLLKTLNDQIFDFSSVPLVSLSTSKATTRIDGATQVTATGDVTVHSEATSVSQPTFSGLLVLSAAWGESTAAATTQVQGTSQLTAGGAAKVQASTDVTVAVSATISTTNKPIDAVFVRADNSATTTAETGDGTRIRGNSIEVSAANASDISVSGTAANNGGSGMGIAVAVNTSKNDVTAKLGGDAASTGGATRVDASIVIAKNTTAADASTLGNPSSISAQITNFTAGIQRNVVSGVLGATGKLSGATGDKIANFMFPGIKEGKFNLSGAVTYSDSANAAQASIADGAKVQSAAGLDVTASIQDRPSASVGAKTTSTGTAVGGAVALANFSNDAQAWIGKGATVDAKGALKVDAQTRVPYPWQINWNSPDAILNHLQSNVLDLVFTTFGINSAAGKSGVGAAAAVTVFNLDNNAQAFIDEGAKVNTTAYAPGTQSLPDQTVTVHAQNEVNTVHAVGIAGKKVLGTTGGKAAIGGSADVVDIDSTASATIRGGAEVRAAQSVTVKAEQTAQIVTVAEAGGSSDAVGIEGAVTVDILKQSTLAGIDDDAKVQSGGPVTVQADASLRDIAVAGGVVATKGSVGIGFAVTVNQVDTDTTARIGNVDLAGRDAAGANGFVNSAGALNVKADAVTEVGAYSVAGALATNSKAQTEAPSGSDSSTQSGSSGAGTGKFGIAVSGDAAYNDVTANTTAAIADGAQVNQATDVTVRAHNDLAINALSGAVTISTQSNGNGLAGSVAYNTLDGSTAAFVDGAHIASSGAMAVEALSEGEIKSLSASLQASRGKLGVAGSVSINELAHWTQAYIQGSDLSGLSGLSLSARDSAAIRSVAGALAFGGKAGIGLSFGWNHINNQVAAAIRNSDVNTAGAVQVDAQSTGSIDTIAASLGASTGEMAGAAAVAINQIGTQTSAQVEGRKTAAGIDAASLSVRAVDTSDINAIVGALGLSTGKAAFGVSFAWNNITSGVQASLLNTTVDTTGAVEVLATHDADIKTYAMGGGAAAKVGVSGSLALNDIGTTLGARSQGSAVTSQGGGVAITASERARIFAATGALSGGGTAAVGASGSYNHITGTVLAEVQGGSLTARNGSVRVDAARDGEVEVWAAAGSGGGTAGFAGSIAINDVGGETRASVNGAAQVRADHNVGVTAQADDRIFSQAGTVALGGTVGGGGAIAINDLHNQTTAEVTGSGTQVNALAQGGALSVDNGQLSATSGLRDNLNNHQLKDAVRGTAVVASSTSQVETVLANVAGGGEVGVAATVSVNLLGGSTTAQVTNQAAVQSTPGDATGASTSQDARVGAYHHDAVIAGAGGLAVGGTAGVGGAADTTVLSHATKAQVNNASVSAQRDVAVAARHTIGTQQVVVGASGGGVASLNLSGTVLLAKMQTEALAEGATLKAGRNAALNAGSELKAEHLVGGLSAAGAAGVGASVVVTVAEQQARAATSGNTVIDANGTTTVSADSVQDVTVNAATGTAAGAVGIAGTVAVTVLKGQTDAAVGGSTRINQNTATGLAGQDVVVQASERIGVDNKLGALAVGVGGGGVGATADVTLVKSGTSATVGAGAQLRAGGDIRVDAGTQRDVASLTVAASGGYTFGISGAVSYIGVGGRADSGAQSELSGSVADAGSLASGNLTGGQASSDAGGTSASTQRVNTARSSVALTNDFNTVPVGTSAVASVGSGATLNAGRDVAVQAHTQTDVKATAAGVAVSGGVSLGGGVAIARIDDDTRASVAGSITAARRVLVQATDGQARTSSLTTYAGGGGLAGLGASVTLLDKTSRTLAEVAPDAHLTALGSVAGDAANPSGDVTILAGNTHSLNAEALGAAVGLGGIGAAVAHANEAASATAQVGDRAVITAKSLDVHGRSSTTTSAKATAAAGGIVSGAGADAKATDSASAVATLGQGAQVTTTGGLTQVRADIDPVTRSQALGVAVSAGVSIGVSLAKSEATGKALATTGTDVNVQAGSFQLSATTLPRSGANTATADATGAAGGLLLGAGATAADAVVQTRTQAALGDGSSVQTTDDLRITANSSTATRTDASGVYAAGVLAGGSNRATSRSTTTTTAGAGDKVTLTSNKALVVQATGADSLLANTTAGAGGLGTLVASKAETYATSTTTANLGTLDGLGGTTGTARAASLSLGADQSTQFNATADSTSASVVGYSGARAHNEVNTDTRVNVGKGFAIDTQALRLQAANHIVKAALASGYNVDSASGGLLNGAAARSESLIRNHALVTLGENARLSVNVAGTAWGSFDVSAFNEVHAHDSVRLDSGGAIAVARSESEVRNDVNEGKVSVGANATLTSDGEINLSSRTVSEVFTEARAKTYGVAGAAQGQTLSEVGADNQVNVAGGALIEAERDVHLMAGTDRSAANVLNADADTRLWNRTAVPIETDPDAHAQVVQTNTIDVAAGAQVRSVRSVYLNAEEGRHTTRGFGEGTDAYREILSAIGNFFGADTSALKIQGGSTWDNARSALTPPSGVNVDGKVEAGIWHLQYLTFGADGSVSKSQNVNYTLRDNVNLTTELSAEITALRTKATAVRNSANNYIGDANATDVADALDNDARILEAQLMALGANTKVGFLGVGPVLATTGNVNITGRNLTGAASGQLIAPGDVRIDIVNQSTRFMTTSTLTIPTDDGGQVLFNGASVNSAAQVNAKNARGSGAALQVQSAATSPRPVISVRNTNSTDTATGSPAQLWLRGDISNLDGLAEAKSHGTIRSSGNIDAETVDIATGGDFIKTYTPGFTHQGGNPISQLGSLPDDRENAAMALNGSDATDSVSGDYSTSALTRNCSNGVCSSTIAGNNVYISGEKLNINGLIQAGVADRRIVIDNTLVAAQSAAIAQARAKYQSTHAEADRYVDLNNPEPGSDGIQVRYDVANERLELANVRIGGGHMELYGNIFSTGNGELRVLDGYGRIDVQNTTAYDLAINRLDAGQGVEGLIRITDTAKRVLANGQVDDSGFGKTGKALVTEITRLGNLVQTHDSRTVDADGKPTYLVSESNGRTSGYDPVANRRFNWINGRTQSWTEQRIYTQKVLLGVDAFFPDYDNPDNVIPGTPVYTARLTGDWLSVGGGNAAYKMDYTQVTSDKVQAGPQYKISETCVGLCSAAIYKELTQGTDFKWTVQEYFQHSLYASNNIKVTFTGHDTAKVDVASTQGKVLLNGMVRGLTGDTTITAPKGIASLSDQAVIVAQNLVLSAQSGAIGSATAPVRINLTDADATRGLVNGSLTALARDGVAIEETDGDLRVAAAQATAGALNLTADRHLLTTEPSVVLQGTDVRLVSRTGTLGTAASPLRIDTSVNGVLSAEAAGDIQITEVSGDLRVQQVRSRAGDVALNVPTGSLIDANNVDVEDTKSTSELLALWDNMRLRGQGASDSADQTVRNEERRVTNEYQRYWQLRNVRDLGNGQSTADAFNPNFRYTLSTAQATALKQANGWTDADVARFEQAQTDAYFAANARFGSQPYNANFAYTVSDAERVALRDGSSWTDAQLGNAIGAGLFRPVADTETRIEDPNVVGRNLRFTVAGTIGEDVDPAFPGGIIVPRNLNGVTLTKEQKLALLTAEKQDITLTPTEVRIAVKKDFDVEASGTLTAQANGTVLIGSESDLAIAQVRTPGEVRIKSGAGLSNGAPDGTAAITAQRLVLEAGQGSIGSAAKPMWVDIADGGTLTARARQSLFIGELTGDMRINTVYAQQGATLTAPGAILDAGFDRLLDVQARLIDLSAGTTIGTAGGVEGALEVSTGANGTLNASAPGGVYLAGMGGSSRLGNVTTIGDFGFDALSGDLTVAGRVQAGNVRLASDNDLVFDSLGRIEARVSADLSAGVAGQGDVVAAAGSTPQVTAPVVRVSAANAIGDDAAALRIASPDVTLQAQDIRAQVSAGDQPLTLSVSGAPAVAGQPARSVVLDLDAQQGSTFSLLNAERATTTTNGPLTVQQGLLLDVARFFTPWYSIRIDAADRRGQTGYDVRGFTLNGRYDLIVTPQAALIGAYVLTGNPEKVIFSNPSGVTTGQTQTGSDLNAQRDQAGARGLALARGVQGNLAPAAGLLQIGGDLFDCQGHERECAALGLPLAAPAAGQ